MPTFSATFPCKGLFRRGPELPHVLFSLCFSSFLLLLLHHHTFFVVCQYCAPSATEWMCAVTKHCGECGSAWIPMLAHSYCCLKGRKKSLPGSLGQKLSRAVVYIYVYIHIYTHTDRYVRVKCLFLRIVWSSVAHRSCFRSAAPVM